MEATDLAAAREREIFGALIRDTAQLVESLADPELVLVADFMERLGGVVHAHAQRLAVERSTRPTR